ncbi:ubiquinol oxidase 1c, mitochondrial-like [Oryza brachyantha]|uniref:ubiquinol oxidase 1c, mitochondrial-like n=1 Tax=Oryza brachyantha TaxID=4533 RepID=UPI001ADA9101|nr:ubiquinol oxidase 1c, mitochondrial-like [Oryza brachyantha]
MTSSSLVAGSVLLRRLAPRLSSPAPAAAAAAATAPRVPVAARGGEGGVAVCWVRLLSTSAAAAAAKEEAAASKENAASTAAAKAEATKAAKEGASSYWGIAPSKLATKDGVEWKWSCFRPWETYSPDTTIDLKKHHEPKVLLDKVAYWTVKALRVPTDIFFQRRYGCRAMMLETVAAVPGMVGGMLLHLRSLRRFEPSGGWIRALLEEAENERMHLMTFMEVAKPRWYERALVLAVQGVFFNAYFIGYLLSPKLAHRVVGYLEEEAIHSYTEFLKEIEAGKIENIPAPPIAIDYWRLPADATLRDVVVVVRADEAHHRDVNHFASDVHFQGMELKDTPAPLDYH